MQGDGQGEGLHEGQEEGELKITKCTQSYRVFGNRTKMVSFDYINHDSEIGTPWHGASASRLLSKQLSQERGCQIMLKTRVMLGKSET